MSEGRRRLRVAVVLLAAAVLTVAGCGGDDEERDGTGRDGTGRDGTAADWPSATQPRGASGLSYATGDTVRLPDGSTLSVGAQIATFVVGADGVFFTREQDDAGPSYGGYLQSRPLYYSDGDGTATEVARAVATPRTSADGRYLAFLDLASGKQDGFGTPQAQAVVVDVGAGEEVARSTVALGDPDSGDDLRATYSEAMLGVLAIADGSAYYQGVGEVVSVDLATGKAAVAAASADDFRLPPDDDRRSPDGRWSIVDDDRDYPAAHDSFRAADGRTVQPTRVPAVLDLLWWVDDDTAAGIAVDGGFDNGLYAAGTAAELVTCEVPSGRCAPVAGTSGTAVHVPEGTATSTSFELPDGR